MWSAHDISNNWLKKFFLKMNIISDSLGKTSAFQSEIKLIQMFWKLPFYPYKLKFYKWTPLQF